MTTGSTMQVKMTRSKVIGPGEIAAVGDIVTLPAHIARRFIYQRAATAIEPEQKKGDTSEEGGASKSGEKKKKKGK